MDSSRSRLSQIFFLLFLFIPISSSHSAAGILEGTVVNVGDGDTVTVLDSDKREHKIRINASRRRMGEFVARKEVRVEFNKRGRYGRIVGKGLPGFLHSGRPLQG